MKERKKIVSRLQALWAVWILSISFIAVTSCDLKPSSPESSAAAASPVARNSDRPDHPATSESKALTPSGRDPLMEQGARFMAVLMDYKRRLEKDSKDKEALRFLGNANYDISRFDQAKEYYKRYLELDPMSAAVRTDLATSYYHLGDVDSALHELRTVLSQTPDHEAALYNYGLILWKNKGDKSGAITAWETLLKTHPNYSKAAEVRKQMDEMKKS